MATGFFLRDVCKQSSKHSKKYIQRSKIKWNGVKKNPTANFSTPFYPQNQTKSIKNFWGVSSHWWRNVQIWSVQERAWMFQCLGWRGRAGWGKGREWGWKDTAMNKVVCSVLVEAFGYIFLNFSNFSILYPFSWSFVLKKSFYINCLDL